jgi:hypothetical protein
MGSEPQRVTTACAKAHTDSGKHTQPSHLSAHRTYMHQRLARVKATPPTASLLTPAGLPNTHIVLCLPQLSTHPSHKAQHCRPPPQSPPD